jgi:type I restriction enzyme S subunit
MDSENDELPDGWTVSTVGELGQVQLGKMLDRAKNQGSPVSYLRNISVRWFDFALEDLKSVRVSDEELARFSVEDGDLFICEGGEPGRCAVWRNGSNTMVYQKALHRFRTKGAILPVLLMYRLRQEAEIGRLHEWFSGSTIKHLTRENFVKFEVPVPPLAEQKRIADKLEAVLGRVDACRARLDRVPALLKRFRQSVLAAATSGKLTEEWRMTNGVNDEWESKELGSLTFDGPKNGLYKSSTSYGQGVRILRIDNFYAGYTSSWEGLKRLTVSDAELNDFGLEVGDIVVNRVNSMSHLGKSALIRDLPEPCVFESNMMRLRLHVTQIMPEFGILVLTSVSGIGQLQQNAKQAVNQASINQTDVKSVKVALPTLPEQQEIVRRVEELFALADRIEARLAVVRRTADRLTPAVLAKAFRGELVPQDPNDEPASVLLERLQSQAAAQPARAPRKKRA